MEWWADHQSEATAEAVVGYEAVAGVVGVSGLGDEEQCTIGIVTTLSSMTTVLDKGEAALGIS